MTWTDRLRINPLKTLLLAENPALLYYVKRDLLNEHVEPIETLWDLTEVNKIKKKQKPNGSWKYPGKTADKEMDSNHDLFETFRNLRYLVEKFGLSKPNPVIQKAAEYIFSCQTEEGDIRGILSNQYAPYYTGAMLALLIKAGYFNDSRVEKGLQWLLSMRQNDGGWIIPLQVYKITYIYQVAKEPPIPPNRSKPFSHLATGMILRAFAAHPNYHNLPEIIHAGELLKSRFFQKDAYNDHKGVEYWTKFQFPFFWTDLLSSLDTLFWLGFSNDDPDITRGLSWFVENQSGDGLWKASYEKREDMHQWVTLAVCRLFKYYHGV
jgi:hypothetical protein